MIRVVRRDEGYERRRRRHGHAAIFGRGPGATVVSTAGPTLSLGTSLDWIERSLKVAEARLAALSPETPLAEPHKQELHEIRLLVAALATELLGEGHPIVSGIAGAQIR
jgi:hypothetical protein